MMRNRNAKQFVLVQKANMVDEPGNWNSATLHGGREAGIVGRRRFSNFEKLLADEENYEAGKPLWKKLPLYDEFPHRITVASKKAYEAMTDELPPEETVPGSRQGRKISWLFGSE